MIKQKLIDFLVFKLNEYELINELEHDKYAYALEVLWLFIFPFVVIIPVSLALDLSYEGIALLIPFSVLRRICGGFHFKSERTCYCVSIAYLIIIAALGKRIADEFAILIAVISGICLIINGIYLQGENNSGIVHEMNLYIVLCTVVTVGLYFAFSTLSKWMALGLSMTAMLQIPLVIRKMIDRIRL